MSSFIAIALMASLGVLHLRVRRHAGWTASAVGRTYILLGYPTAAFAAYWLTSAPTITAWEWAVGCAWSLVAAASFAAGLSALKRVAADHAEVAAQIESIEPATGTLRY
ncbi:hypothetical protein ACAG24_006965 [Mycobacterium sp. pW049]|uniref:hypothetical protein n=1 Tax=[Mycobacterium] bulgaricum TaxID=3238985 RepID=UPI00351B4CA7